MCVVARFREQFRSIRTCLSLLGKRPDLVVSLDTALPQFCRHVGGKVKCGEYSSHASKSVRVRTRER